MDTALERELEGLDEIQVTMPERVGQYTLLEEIGRGGMGVVHRAVDPATGAIVALKASLEPDLDRAVETLRSEAEALSAVQSENVVRLVEASFGPPIPFLAMELLEGVTLDKEFGGRILPLERLLRRLTPVLFGLHEVHEAGWLHRDIKPHNIMLTSEGRIVLMDFGLAIRSGTKAGDGPWRGTPLSMSPEQILGDVPEDPRSDLFAFGGMLYEGLTGRLPFHGNTINDVLDSILLDTPVAPSTLNPSVPLGMERLVLQLLEKDRDHRPSSAVEVIVRLWEGCGRPITL